MLSSLSSLSFDYSTFEALHAPLCWAMVLSGVATVISLMTGLTAPYGRYSRNGWGFMLNARLAWMTQELPALLVPLAIAWAAGPHGWPSFAQHWGSPRTALAACFLCHYAYRALVYPLLIRGGKGSPFSVWLMALVFCLWNGFLQGWFLVHQLPETGRWQPHHFVGLSIWCFGWLAVVHSDSVLRNLRKDPGDTGYKIPSGGMFGYVSAANYGSEIIEWAGYAIMSWSLPGAAFACFTFANLAPRGRAHHQWYLRKFEDYPTTRKAVMPLLW